jgi:predicted Zn finger-like uncharacterized protein
MSLVTRCTACGTLFKVVADQLKISEGWVRCGQCAHVFDAPANLVDSQRQESASMLPVPPAMDSVSAPASAAASTSLEAQLDSLINSHASTYDSAYTEAYSHQNGQKNSNPKGEQALLQAALSASIANKADLDNSVMPDQQLFAPGLLRDSDEIDSEVGPSTTSWASSEYASQQPGIVGIPQDASISRSAEPTTLNPFAASSPQHLSLPGEPSGINTTEPSTQPLPTPSFVKQAQRAARWRSPWMRLGLTCLAMLLTTALVLQLLLNERNLIAANYPQSKSWLEQLCETAGCRIEPLKRIESIVIDSSSFNRVNKNNPSLEASTQSYKLGIALKNNGNLPVAMPHVELSLQDTQDQPIVRRVLSPADLGSSLDRLQPAQEMAGTLTLQIPTAQLAGRLINGYRVLAFYP